MTIEILFRPSLVFGKHRLAKPYILNPVNKGCTPETEKPVVDTRMQEHISKLEYLIHLV